MALKSKKNKLINTILMSLGLIVASVSGNFAVAANIDNTYDEEVFMHYGNDKEVANKNKVCPNSEEYVYLSSMYYKTGSYKVDSVKSDLIYINGYEKAKKAFNSDNTIWVFIAGYTDNLGQELNNEILAWNRARYLAKDLIKKGVDADQIYLRGINGSKISKYENNNASNRSLNRRSDVKVSAIDRQTHIRCVNEHPESIVSDWMEE